MSNLREETRSIEPRIERNNANPCRFQLERDVQQLQQKLSDEMELNAFLDHIVEKNATSFSNPSYLPYHVKELLSSVALLEAAVSKLEQETISLHFQLSQERNKRRLREYHLRNLSSQSISRSSFDVMNTQNAVDSIVISYVNNDSTGVNIKSWQPADFRSLPKGMPPMGLWDHPNQLSEEMVRCMRNIFISLADSAISTEYSAIDRCFSPPSPRGHLHNSLWWSKSEWSTISSWMRSPQIDIQSNHEVLASENVFDPYRVHGKLSRADIGNYGLATRVSWMSIGKKQLEYAAGALRRFRTLVELLAKVNPILLSCSEKLAFWINFYNALIMHAAYTVGGHSFSAAGIEYVILRMKSPLHRPQIALLLALHKQKMSEEQRKFEIDKSEPLIAFALSCGMYSSPAVRIYTAKNVSAELQDAQLDYIRASVGVSSKGRLLVPKMLHCFARGFVDDANLAVWISNYLPLHQAAFVEECISQRRQNILGSRNCGILPYDSRFRYLFLPDNTLSDHVS